MRDPDYVSPRDLFLLMASLPTLRQHFPDWSWTAQRALGGFGWQYRGTRAGQSVAVRAYSDSLRAYDGDERYTTRWMVGGPGWRCPLETWTGHVPSRPSVL